MLPFIVGIAAGATAVVAFNNRKEISAKVSEGAGKAKKAAESGYQKTKALAEEVKESVGKKVDCLGSKAKETPEETPPGRENSKHGETA